MYNKLNTQYIYGKMNNRLCKHKTVSTNTNMLINVL